MQHFLTTVFNSMVLAIFLVLSGAVNGGEVAAEGVDNGSKVPEEIASDVDVWTYLRNDERFSIFNHAADLAGLSSAADGKHSVTIFAPQDEALQADGSAFLLEVVLPKPENRQRLSALLGYHLFLDLVKPVDQLQVPAKLLSSNGACFVFDSTDGMFQLGPEAHITGSIAAANGTIFIIDKLLWQPYLDTEKCAGEE